MMSKTLINLKRFHDPLREAGLVPPNCKVLHIAIGVDGALTVQYEIFLEAEELVKLGAVFQQVGHAVLDGQ